MGRGIVRGVVLLAILAFGVWLFFSFVNIINDPPSEQYKRDLERISGR